MRMLRLGNLLALGAALMLAHSVHAGGYGALPPINLIQTNSDFQFLGTGASTAGSANPFRVYLGAYSDPGTCDPTCDYTLELEIRPVGTPFTNTPTHSVFLGPKPSCEAVLYPPISITGLIPSTSYKWQCRERIDCDGKQEVTTIAPNGIPVFTETSSWVQYNGNSTAFTTNGTWAPWFLLGYVPESDNGVGRFFFFDKHPYPAAQSWFVEVRRSDSNVYLHKRKYNFPGGPPPGDVARSGTFDLPLLDPINAPTSFEVALMVRVRVFSGLDATGTQLYSSEWLYDVHPSAQVSVAPFLPGLDAFPAPTGPGKQDIPFGDFRPTGPNLGVRYDTFQKLVTGPQTHLNRSGHGIIGVFTEKKVHPPTIIQVKGTLVPGDSLFFVRPRRRHALNNGQDLGVFDVAPKSPNSYFNIGPALP